MPIRRSPNGAAHTPQQTGRNRPEWVVAINRNAWSQSIGTGGRNHPECAAMRLTLALVDKIRSRGLLTKRSGGATAIQSETILVFEK